MPKPLAISRAQARRFLLQHQRLLPPGQLEGKAGLYLVLDSAGEVADTGIEAGAGLKAPGGVTIGASKKLSILHGPDYNKTSWSRSL